MAYPHQITYRRNPEGYLLTIALSMVVGYLIVNVSFLGTRWIVCGLAALVLLISSVTVINMKHFFLTLYFLCLPIGAMNYLGTLDNFHYGGAAGLYHTVYDFFLLILLCLWIPQVLIRKTETIKFTFMDVSVWLIFIMSFLSLHNADGVNYSVYELFRLTIMYLTFLYISNLRKENELKFIIVPLLIGLAIQCVVGIVQYVTGGFLGLNLLGERTQTFMLGEYSRVGGTMGHPNAFARYLGFLIPLTFALGLAPIKGRYKLLCGSLFILSSVALVMTFSRAAWGGLVISLIIIIVLSMMARLISWQRALSFSLIGLLSLACVAFAFKDAIIARLFADDAGSIASRIPQIEIALNIIQAHPIIGVGINNYAEVMHQYDNTSERITSWFPMTVHNVYLLIAAEIGIPGLLFFLIFIFGFFRKGFQVIRHGDPVSRALAVGIVSGVTAFLIQILVMPPTLTSASFLFFWIFTGLVVALRNREETAIEDSL